MYHEKLTGEDIADCFCNARSARNNNEEYKEYRAFKRLNSLFISGIARNLLKPEYCDPSQDIVWYRREGQLPDGRSIRVEYAPPRCVTDPDEALTYPDNSQLKLSITPTNSVQEGISTHHFLACEAPDEMELFYGPVEKGQSVRLQADFNLEIKYQTEALSVYCGVLFEAFKFLSSENTQNFPAFPNMPF